MPTPEHNTDRNEAINKLAADANLPDVAEWLDLRVVGRNTLTPKTLCPFHSDQRPSMHLYPASGSGRAHFHCFSCGAHGDVFDLIKRQLNVDFSRALEWLAERYRVALPTGSTTRRTQRLSPRVQGLELGLAIYSQQSAHEEKALREWAQKRKMEVAFLQSVEVFAVFPPKITKILTIAEREKLDALDAAGLILRDKAIRNGESLPLPFETAPRDFYSTTRVLFTIRDDRGAITGFAGRAIGAELPKYLFTPGFPRGDTLYRFHKVRAARPPRGAKGLDAVVHIFIVEGLMDALRLEALGLHAVALLGSQITAKQVELLTDYAKDLDRDNLQLSVHLLLDSDEAGRRGAVNATVKLLDASVDAPGMLMDVLIPPMPAVSNQGHGHDPDELFRGIEDSEAALTILSEWCEAPMNVLLARAVDATPSKLDSIWEKLPDGQRLQAFRDVERRLDRARWIEVLDRVLAFECHLRPSPFKTPDWQEPLRRFLRAARGRSTMPTAVADGVLKDDRGRLIRALQIAEASTQRREFPVDEGSWDRLQAAIDVTIPHLCSLLEVADDRAKLDADPMLAVYVPKGDGKFRLKALPCPEILTLQQYVLNELLREYSECPRFRGFIPGVRSTPSSRSRRIETTGPDRLVPFGGETVSFAYMLDMDVIEHRAPPRRTGMFRPYFECWREFISFIDARVAAFPPGAFHVARLDIRSFYDTVSRPVVNDVLLQAVTDALAELAESTKANDASVCAPLFLPNIKTSKDRTVALVDWLCDQSFDYQFENPGSVEPPERSNGLPQGPDLSAYLANISLFPLDRALSELVAKLNGQASEEQGETIGEGQTSAVRGAVYARYVDDMVIIARTSHDLTRLRMAVEQQLARVGMELSPKTEPLPVMDEAGVREWLTDRRGAGLGVSGPFDGPPTNTPLSLMEPLADAGETDRSDSLRILHDPRLDDPETSAEELESAVEMVLAAPDLRHGDKASAARHLWRIVISEPDNTLTPAQDVVSAFVKRWRETESSRNVKREKESSGDAHEISNLLAWLDGIERFLTSRPDRNPTFSEKSHKILYEQRERMADMVHEGLCEILILVVLPKSEGSRFEHMLDLKSLVIHRAASLIRPSSSYNIRIEAGQSRAKARLLISLAEAQRSPKLLDHARLRASDTPLGILFHEAVARLRIADHPSQVTVDHASQDIVNHVSQAKVDPLKPVSDSMNMWEQRGDTGQLLEMVLHLWMPRELGTEDMPQASDTKYLELGERTLSALVNLAPKSAVSLIEIRPPLKKIALNGSGLSEIRFLPTPPGLDIPGLLGLYDEDKYVLRVDFKPVDNTHFCPSQLSWSDNGGSLNSMLKRTKSSLDDCDYHYIAPQSGDIPYPTITKWLAKAFRSLVSGASLSDQELSCPPTASNILERHIRTGTAESEWHVLGFCVSAAKLSGQAFLRQGEGGLVLEPVLKLNDHLWRVGTALADWLGRAPSTRQLSTQRLAAPALFEKKEEDWAREAMLRFSLCRLRGKSLPARPLRLSSTTGLPMTVERVLKRLESFPSDSEQSTGIAGVAHLLATLAEGRAIQTRIDTRIDPATPGGGTALLMEMVRGQFRADEELAQRLPDTDTALADWAPKRRPVKALFALVERLTSLAEVDPLRADDLTLGALASGSRLLSLELQLRSQALELWSLLDIGSRLRFQNSPPNLAEWNLDTTALLHREQPSPLKGAPVPEDWRNVRELFQQLHKATSESQRVHWGALAGITPLGWLVVLGSLTGTFTGDWRGGLVDSSAFGSEDKSLLAELASHLALTGTDGDDLPWGGLERVISAWDRANLDKALKTLNLLDEAAGLRVDTHESSRFYIESSRRGPTEVHISDGHRQIPGWTISWAKTIDESRGIERVATFPGQAIVYRWSETWRGDRLVGLGVVQPAMVALAGKAFMSSVHPSLTSVPSTSIKEQTTSPLAAENAIHAEKPSLPTITEVEEQLSSAKTTVLPRSKVEVSDDIALDELKILQEDSWKSRKEKAKSHVRVALFQWDVDETYRHPFFDLCDNHSSKEGTKLDRQKPELWTVDAKRISCAEHRRRILLKAALKACGSFCVDVLLLPEYSVRPDTVKWLADQVPQLAPKTTVWAGTYRLPPGMAKPKDPRDWSAILEVVVPEPEAAPPPRLKKYPSSAADEVFYPGDNLMKPIMDRKLDDVRSFISELICSEVFLATFPGNLLPLAQLRRDLLRKFGGIVGGKDLNAMIEHIMADITEFAHNTAINENLGIRRTILLVPAMTSRCQDYSVLGQAAFLSSGLTTVFCNAVQNPYGHGQSCFIGHDGWQSKKQISGLPTMKPYHGVEPGIFQLGEENGCLGQKEQALVIADIDPIYGSEGKPRPQTLLKPLRLVAHLPVLETWKPKSDASENACRCEQVNRNLDVDKFAPILRNALKRKLEGDGLTTARDPEPKILANALEKLAETAGSSSRHWLILRKEAYEKNHRHDPNPWPPPVALDWLWVDPGPIQNDAFPEIEVPAYAAPPGGESRA